MDSDPDLSQFNLAPPPPRRSMGSRVGIGIGLSLLVWVGVDELLSVLNIWVFFAILAIAVGFALRAGGRKHLQQLQIALMLLAGALTWLFLGFIFSLFSYWVIIAATAGLGAVVWYKDRQIKQRQSWLDQGCCGGCGYDLRASPDRCPECGRERTLDEPTWRKLQREWGHIKPVDEVDPPPPAQSSTEPMPVIPLAMTTPDFHEDVLPLEEVPEPRPINPGGAT